MALALGSLVIDLILFFVVDNVERNLYVKFTQFRGGSIVLVEVSCAKKQVLNCGVFWSDPCIKFIE